jgi:sugar (pentulose or hexulose) kinase
MYLGIDLGTSEVKALLLDATGRIVGQAGAPLTVSRPQPLWSEQDPLDWRRAMDLAVASLRGTHAEAFAQVRAIGLSGQMHGAVLLDERDEVLRPAILWNDGRSEPQCAELTERAPRLHADRRQPRDARLHRAQAAVGARPRAAALREGSPGAAAQGLAALVLSGEKVTDPSDAAGTLWLDVAARDWSDELLAACGMTRAQMPRARGKQRARGLPAPDVAEGLGPGPGMVIAGGGGDNAASAIGIGATQPGDGFVSLGTSGVLFVVSDRYRPNPASAVHAFCHALPGRWHQMSVMLSAASALKLGRAAHRPPRRGRAAGRGRQAWTTRCWRGAAVPALPRGRAHAAQQPVRQGRLPRSHARAHARPLHVRRARRRHVRPVRRPRRVAGSRHRGAPAAPGGRRRAQLLLGAAAARHVPDAARHAHLQHRLQRFRALYQRIESPSRSAAAA